MHISNSPVTFTIILIMVILRPLPIECNEKRLEDLQKNAKRPPPSSNGGPLMVHTGVYMESLGKFRSTEMSFNVDLYLYLSWRDPSLSHDGNDFVLVRDDSVRQQLWTPDLYFSNARSAQFHHVTAPNFNMFISPNGTVAYSNRVTLTVACNLDLVNYPMDRQTCVIRILSYAYVESQMNVTWFTRNPIRYNPDIGLPEFGITGVRQGYCDGTYDYAITEFSHKTDRFSCLEGIVNLRRSIGYHLVQSFIPTGLIVCISWVSFFIDRRAVPARVTLSFTTLLSLSTLGNGLRFGLPQVSYAKAIDYWFGACMIFLLASLLEFAIVNSYMRKASKYDRLANSCNRLMSRDLVQSELEKEDGEEEVDEFSPATQIRETMALFNEENRSRKESKSTLKKLSFVNGTIPTGDSKTSPINNNDTGHKATKKKTSSSSSTNVLNKLSNNNNGRHHSIRTMNDQFVVYDLQSSLRLSELEDDDDEIDVNDTEMDHLTRSRRISSQIVAQQKPLRSSIERRGHNHAGYSHYIRMGIKYSRKALLIDKRSRIFFPLAFVVMNVLFWSYYLVYMEMVSIHVNVDE